MPFIHAANISLQEQLLELREAARQELIDAASNDESDDVLEAKEAAVQKCDDFIKKAFNYSLDISHELNRKEGSELDIDIALSKDKGVQYITLRSLDRWAKKRCSITILQPDAKPDKLIIESTSEEEFSDEKSSSLIGKEGISKRVAENLYTTFAFLLEAYVDKHLKALRSADGSVNVSATARELTKRISENPETKDLRGQGEEAIKDRIEEAMKIKKNKLQSR